MNPIHLAAAGFCLTVLPTAPVPAPISGDSDPKMDIVDTAKSAGSFQTLLTAVRTAGLEGVLRGKGPFTVFAPTDAAFARLPKGTLAALLKPANRTALKTILTYHVVSGNVDAAQALRAGTATTLAKQNLKIELRAGRLQVQGANVIQNDIATKNGTIHVIDRVLLPEMNKTNAILETTAQSLIETAVERGVPLYNDGQEAACAAIYELTARALMQSTEVSATDRAKIGSALRRAAGESRKHAAWTLRAVLDSTYAGLIRAESKKPRRSLRKRTSMTSSQSKSSGAESTSRTPSNRSIFEFEAKSEASSFRPLNDTVMGGRSSSRMESKGTLGVFTGEVSLENRGGFASVRAPIEQGALSGTAGIKMRFRGDGRTYRLTTQRGGASYDTEFRTQKGEWSEIEIPFAKLRRNIRGWRPNAKPPAAKDLTGLGILIGDKKAGAFRLEIDWIRAYSD